MMSLNVEWSWLIIKNDSSNAEEIFENTGINITSQGKKYLGGYVGRIESPNIYVKNLVDSWIESLQMLLQSLIRAYRVTFKWKY